MANQGNFIEIRRNFTILRKNRKVGNKLAEITNVESWKLKLYNIKKIMENV